MARNRKKHKKKEKIIKYDVKETVPVSTFDSVPVSTKKVIKKSVSIDWSKMKVMTTGKERRGPIYV